MRQSVAISLALFAAVLVAAFLLRVTEAYGQVHRRYEFLTMQCAREYKTELNILGSNGWEIKAAVLTSGTTFATPLFVMQREVR